MIYNIKKMIVFDNNFSLFLFEKTEKKKKNDIQKKNKRKESMEYEFD